VSIPLIKPTPPTPEVWQQYLTDSYQTNHFCNFGPALQNLQIKIKNYFEFKNKPIVCCNATLALEIALLATELKDSEILVPSFTFAATALAVERTGNKPILVDSDYVSWHISLADAAKRLSKKTAAIIVVHPLGMVTDPLPFIKFAAKHKLLLIFDSAASLGSVYPGSYSPDSTGLCEIFSGHITKSLGMGEGGFIVSDDSDFLERCRRISNFGFNEDAEVELLGTNAKMSDFQAAVGLAVMETIAQTLQTRRDLAAHYIKQLTQNSNVLFQCKSDQLTQHTFPFFPIRYQGDIELLKKTLAEHQIGYRQYYKPLHLHPRYRDKKKNKKSEFPMCNALAEKVLCLPCHNEMTLEDVNVVCALINKLEKPTPKKELDDE